MDAGSGSVGGERSQADACRALVELDRRRGSVTVDDVDSLLPDGSGAAERAELLSELAVEGVLVHGAANDLQAARIASPSRLYYKDIRAHTLLGQRGEEVLSYRLRRADLLVVRAASRTVAGARAAADRIRASLAHRSELGDVLSSLSVLGGRSAVPRLLARLDEAIAACVAAERAAVRRWRAHGVPDAVHGRARVRMSREVLRLRVTPSVAREMVAAVGRSRHDLERQASVRLIERESLRLRMRLGDGSELPVERKLRRPVDPLPFLVGVSRRIRVGTAESESARRKLAVSNLRLVVLFAKRLYRPDMGLTFHDLVQEGNLGLLRAVEKFDATKARFSTYAGWWIKQAMNRAVSETGRTVRIPSHIQELSHEISVVENELSARSARRPDSRAIADALGVERRLVDRVRAAPRVSMRIDESPGAGAEEDGDGWAARLPDSTAVDPERETSHTRAQEVLWAVMRCELRPHEQAAVCLRFGLHLLADRDGIRQLQTMSRERVRRLEVAALDKLKSSEHAGRLEELLRDRALWNRPEPPAGLA